MIELDIHTKELILDEIMTQERAFVFIGELSFANSILYKDTDASGRGIKQSKSEFNTLFNKLLTDKDLLSSGPDAISDYIQQILTWLKDITPIRYSIAFKPRREFVKSLYEWTKKNVPGVSLIAVEEKPEIMGGVLVSINGKYHDFALEKMLDQYFISNKDAILSILQN